MKSKSANTKPADRRVSVPLADRAMWSVREWAALHGVSFQTVYRWATQGDLTLSKWRGRTFITREASAAWEARMAAGEGERKATPAAA